MHNSLLFIIPSIIWGSTWLVIKFQLGVVDPMVSVSYRFGLAGALLIAYCWLSGRNLRFTLRDHFFFGLQGALLFGFNYWLVYEAELYLTSGLVAVLFSAIIFYNIFFSALFLRNPVNKVVLIGAGLGLVGTILIFQPELATFDLNDSNFLGLVLGSVSVVLASLGNITSAYNQKNALPVVQTNAFGMLYGCMIMLVVSQLNGLPLIFDPSPAYVGSLLYLALFGSIAAFGCYLTLIGRIGPDRAAYTILIIPVIALGFSTLFESFDIRITTVVGIMFLIGGNVLALVKKRSKKTSAGIA